MSVAMEHIIRVAALAFGAFCAVPWYASALAMPRRTSTLRQFAKVLGHALLWTIVAAIGVVGWAR